MEKVFDIKKAQDNLAGIVNCWDPFQFIMISDLYIYGVSQTAHSEPNDATIYQIDNNGEVMGTMKLIGGTHNSGYGVKTIAGKDYIYAPIHTESGNKIVYKFGFSNGSTISENSSDATKLGDFGKKNP
ncbi:phage baseplate protein [Listeria aquatica]|uniref:phage baseplate protein n=1 Tax=Listeria aquatica TaxID=1494960 RepID=UPI003F708DC2